MNLADMIPTFLHTQIPFLEISILYLFEIFVGTMSILFTAIAYLQTNKRKFIYFNIVAITFFGLSITLNGGFLGGSIVFLSIFLYILALFVEEEKQKKMQLFMPIIVFTLYLLIVDQPKSLLPIFANYPELSGLLLPIASAITTFGIYQRDMFANKVIFAIGVSFWAAYSLSIQAYFAFVTDFIGVGVLIATAIKIRRTRICN